ncbi:MAG: prolyl oligopeptidase family serine peptidase [Anaerolineales bacterium]
MNFKVGLKRLFYQDEMRSNWDGTGPRPLITDVWYPAVNTAVETDIFIGSPDFPLFKAGKAARDVQPVNTQKSFPLILLSHGTGGASLQLGWLASYLASEGYIAAAVNHHGNNGLEPYVAKGFLHYWERAKDLSAILDQLLVDQTFANLIDQNQIGAAGFSLGGYTVMAVAGGKTNIQPMIDMFSHSESDLSKAIPPEFTDADAFIKEIQSLGQYVAIADASYRDERIKAVFAIAPVLGQAFSSEGLESIQIPVKIVVGENDQLAPSSVNAAYYALHIKDAELTQLGKVGHYTFLGEGTDGGKREIPLFCLDEDGIDRATIHQKVSRWAKEFFEKHLKVV